MSKFTQVNEQIGRYRWTICGLVFFATTINYLDRNVLGLLKPVLSADGVFGTDKAAQELNYSTVVICFQVAYAVGTLDAHENHVMRRLADLLHGPHGAYVNA